MPVLFIFMEDSDPKHTSIHIPVLGCSTQSSVLNSIENTWNDVKCTIAQQKYKNLDNL